jgi:rhodanese-related sulfurtransferase
VETTANRHNFGFLSLVDEARARVRTFSIEEFVDRLTHGERFVLLDNREDLEWQAGHLPSAHHLGRGVIEREIERVLPDRSTAIVCYCSGDGLSVLVADSLARMGYTNVVALDDGWRGWTERGMPTVTPAPAR